MASYIENSGELVQMLAGLKDVYEIYGPFELLDEDEVHAIPKNQVWTGLWLDHQIIVNGEHASDDTYAYYKSAVPWRVPDGQIRVVEVAWFDCPYCVGDENEPSGCRECEGEGTFEIDLDEILTINQHDFTSESQLWSARTAGGSLGR